MSKHTLYHLLLQKEREMLHLYGSKPQLGTTDWFDNLVLPQYKAELHCVLGRDGFDGLLKWLDGVACGLYQPFCQHRDVIRLMRKHWIVSIDEWAANEAFTWEELSADVQNETWELALDACNSIHLSDEEIDTAAIDWLDQRVFTFYGDWTIA